MSQITLIVDDQTVVYDMVSLSQKEAIYRDTSSELSQPRTIRVAHTPTSKSDGVDRHLVQFSRTDDNAESIPFTGSVHVVIAMPREGVAKGDMLMEWEKLRLLLDTKFSEILGGFQPKD